MVIGFLVCVDKWEVSLTYVKGSKIIEKSLEYCKYRTKFSRQRCTLPNWGGYVQL